MIKRGVSGDITSVNKLKKNNVALGLRTFVKNHILIAARYEISSFLLFSPRSIVEDCEKIDLIPIYIKYPAHRYLITLNTSIDCDIINANQAKL
jgi:hypothetical protein